VAYRGTKFANSSFSGELSHIHGMAFFGTSHCTVPQNWQICDNLRLRLSFGSSRHNWDRLTTIEDEVDFYR
jgi:hypothetical protein